MAMPPISPPKQPQSVSVNFSMILEDPAAFVTVDFSRAIITCTIPFQLRETKPEAHFAPSRRACHVRSPFLLSSSLQEIKLHDPSCISSLFTSLPRTKAI